MTDRSRRDHLEQNARSQHRLQALIARLSPDDYAIPVNDEWTVGATLAHIAFWDRWVAWRWDAFARRGAWQDLPDIVMDAVNCAALPEWSMLPPDAVAALALQSAADVDTRIGALTEEATAGAARHGGDALLDRSRHRGPHLDEIGRAIGGAEE